MFEFPDFNISLHEKILFYTFTGAWFIQLMYYYLLYFRFAIYRNRKNEEVEENPVSVILCAKNEENNLRKNLPFLLEQDYPKYEVIVVNDCSEDNTDLVLSEFKAKYSHLHTTNITKDKKFTHGKKLALTIGVKAANHDILLMTDADCQPYSDKWISTIQRNFIKKKEIILGYGPYQHKKGFLNSLTRFDTFFIALQYFSYALSGIPYMGVGRNMAYKKETFFRNKGFASHAHIASGDDDLFVKENATSKNTGIEINQDSFTYTEPENSLLQWTRKKKRHLTTSRLYKPGTKMLLGLENFS
ncbi:MAG: glycosyltransferase, partial [Bacteroidota bacterium]